MRPIHLLFMVFFFLSALSPFAAAADEVDSILEKLYASSLEARGDYDLFLRELIDLMKENIRSPAAPIIYQKMKSILPACTDPSLLDDLYADLSKLGQNNELPNGLLGFRALRDHRKALLSKGAMEEAESLNAFSPFAAKILAIGPFGFDASSLHDIAYAPEKPLEELKKTRGYAGDVEWTLIERDPNGPEFDLHRRLYPRKGCSYALYQFKLQKRTPVLLLFSTESSAKLWFNETLVEDIDRRKSYLPKGFKLPLTGSKGWNRVLIKLSAGKPVFTLRITNRTGDPLEDLVEMAEVKIEPLSPEASGGVEAFDLGRLDALSFLRSHANLHPEKIFTAMALVEILALKGQVSEAIAKGEEALSLVPDIPHPYHLLGMIYHGARYLPRNFRINRSQELFEKAREIDPDFLPAGLALALNNHQNDRSEKAIGSIRQLLDTNPKYYKAWLTLAEIFDKLEWDKELLDVIHEARKLAPKDPRPLMLLARYYQYIDRHDLALDLFAKALEMDSSRIDFMERVAAYLWDRGKKPEAFDLYERILSLNDSALNRERLAGLHRALGDPIKTREIYQELCREHPGDPRYYTKLGHLALELDGWDGASEWYGKALAAFPGEHSLREILDDWKMLDDALFREFEVDEAVYTRDLPGKEEYPKASALCSLDHMITRIYPDGSSKSEIFQIFKILDKSAVEDYGRMKIPGRIMTLKVIKPDGEVLEPVEAENQGVFNLPGLDVGAIIVLRHILFEESSRGKPLRMGRFYFQDVGGTTPFLFSRLVVALPEKFEISLERTLHTAFEEERLDREDETVYVFTARNVPVAENENMMPPSEAAFPNVRLFQSRDWVQVAQRMADNLYPFIKITEELRKKAEEITEGAENDMEKARAIYRFVNDHVKEDQGPPGATAVLLEEQGSRSTLFLALMDAAGVAYDYLRCGYRPGYLSAPANWSDVSEMLLPGELVRIHPAGSAPKLLSFGSRLVPFGEIPPHFFEAPAMKVTGRPERIETLPGGDPAQYLEEVCELAIKVDFLDAKIQGRFYLPGYARTRFKERIQRMDASSRRRLFEYGILRSIYPGALIKSLEILGIDEEETPPTFTFELEAKDFIQPLAGREGCKLLPVPMEWMGRFIRKTERSHPMVQRGYRSIRLVVELDFIGEYQVLELPDSLVDRGAFLNYTLLVSRTDRGVRIERTVDFFPAEVEPQSYPELIEMLKTIDEREIEPILLKRTGRTEPVSEKQDAARPAGEPEGEPLQDPEEKGS